MSFCWPVTDKVYLIGYVCANEGREPQGHPLTDLAIRALAHKLARASYYMLKEQKPFEVSRLFAH